MGNVIDKKLDKLNQKLNDIDIYHDDLHPGNVMYKRYGDMYGNSSLYHHRVHILKISSRGIL